jgi:5-amino-6-(5-phosphoribosylamino)uracil reductase
LSLPAALTLVYHAAAPHPREVPLPEVYDPLDVPQPAGRPAVIVNMVQTLDGAVAVDGRAWDLGSAVDHYLFRTLRGWADAVLSGAGTLRRNDVVATTHEHLQARRRAAGRAANPAAIVVSRRADFSDEVLRKRFFADQRFRSIVLTTGAVAVADRRRVEDAGAEVWIAPVTTTGEVDVHRALVAARERGITRLLAEGGPRTNQKLAEAGVIDEFFVTVTPAVAGVPAPHLLAGIFGGAPAGLEPISEHQYRAPGLREWYWRFAVRTVRGAR